MSDVLKVVVMDGDETGQELLEQALRVLSPEVLGLEAQIERYDLSLESRRQTNNRVVEDAAQAMRSAGYGLKAATITPEGAEDVGSPNRILREQVDGTVIIRTARRIPGITPVGGVHFPISIVRMAVGDAYGARQWREGPAGEIEERRGGRAAGDPGTEPRRRLSIGSGDADVRVDRGRRVGAPGPR